MSLTQSQCVFVHICLKREGGNGQSEGPEGVPPAPPIAQREGNSLLLPSMERCSLLGNGFFNALFLVFLESLVMEEFVQLQK